MPIYNTKQEIFDQVWNGLNNQNWVQSLSEDKRDDPKAPYGTFCRYWIPEENLKCAVGHLMDEEKYDPNIEGAALQDILHYFVPTWDEKETPFVILLQKTHDNYVRSDVPMKERFETIANHFDLNIPNHETKEIE